MGTDLDRDAIYDWLDGHDDWVDARLVYAWARTNLGLSTGQVTGDVTKLVEEGRVCRRLVLPRPPPPRSWSQLCVAWVDETLAASNPNHCGSRKDGSRCHKLRGEHVEHHDIITGKRWT